MADSLPDLGVAHVRSAQMVAVPRLLRPQRHLIHVAFHNRVDAGEKWIEGRAVPKHTGRVVARSMLLPAGSELRGWTTGSFDFLRIDLAPAALTAAVETGHPGAATFRPQVQLDDPVLWHVACILRADLAEGSPGGRLLRDGLQGVLALRLASIHLGAGWCQPVRRGALSLAQLRAVREYVQDRLHRELRLAELAGVAGLSTFHFARAFKSATGLSPYQHVLEQRLATACRLLEGTALPVGDVGGMVGFQTLTGFGAAFRRRWGVSPGQYRASVRG